MWAVYYRDDYGIHLDECYSSEAEAKQAVKDFKMYGGTSATYKFMEVREHA